MGKLHPIDLRARVVAFVEKGKGYREAARHFPVFAAVCEQHGNPEAGIWMRLHLPGRGTSAAAS